MQEAAALVPVTGQTAAPPPPIEALSPSTLEFERKQKSNELSIRDLVPAAVKTLAASPPPHLKRKFPGKINGHQIGDRQRSGKERKGAKPLSSSRILTEFRRMKPPGNPRSGEKIPRTRSARTERGRKIRFLQRKREGREKKKKEGCASLPFLLPPSPGF